MIIELTPKQLDAINRHTLACYPNEMCGVLIADDFIPLANTAADPGQAFSFDPLDYAQVADKAISIIHSHCRDVAEREHYDLRTPSRADIDSQRRSAKPWLIVGCEGEIVTPPIQFPRIPSAQYTGRPFMWFIDDCYTIVHDYYQFEMGITLPGHADSFDWTETEKLNHAFDAYITGYGFIDIDSIDDLRNGDLLLISTGLMKHNHLGIYHNGEVLHQDWLSRFAPFSNYRGRIDRILRYAD